LLQHTNSSCRDGCGRRLSSTPRNMAPSGAVPQPPDFLPAPSLHPHDARWREVFPIGNKSLLQSIRRAHGSTLAATVLMSNLCIFSYQTFLFRQETPSGAVSQPPAVLPATHLAIMPALLGVKWAYGTAKTDLLLLQVALRLLLLNMYCCRHAKDTWLTMLAIEGW